MEFRDTTARQFLRQFVDERSRVIRPLLLWPMGSATAESEEIQAHLDRLIEIGIIRRARHIRMKHGRPDPVTIELTDAGRLWAARADDDIQWERHRDELRRMFEGDG